MGLVRDVLGNYSLNGTVNEADILAAAEDILRARLHREHSALSSPKITVDFLRMRLGGLAHEEFHIVWLDARYRVITVERAFRGTVDSAAVYPREVVRSALALHGVSAAVLCHVHPSGDPTPSSADKAITAELKTALQMVGVRVLDHIVVSPGECVSFAERGLI